MAANEKQLEKVTLTLTNKMVGSQAGPLTTTHKFQLDNNIHLAFTDICIYTLW